MELSDRLFFTHCDWDPQYLRDLVTQDFYEFKEHWENSLPDIELVKATEGAMATEAYRPLVEDISLDDEALCEAVEQIEYE